MGISFDKTELFMLFNALLLKKIEYKMYSVQLRHVFQATSQSEDIS